MHFKLGHIFFEIIHKMEQHRNPNYVISLQAILLIGYMKFLSYALMFFIFVFQKSSRISSLESSFSRTSEELSSLRQTYNLYKAKVSKGFLS